MKKRQDIGWRCTGQRTYSLVSDDDDRYSALVRADPTGWSAQVFGINQCLTEFDFIQEGDAMIWAERELTVMTRSK